MVELDLEDSGDLFLFCGHAFCGLQLVDRNFSMYTYGDVRYIEDGIFNLEDLGAYNGLPDRDNIRGTIMSVWRLEIDMAFKTENDMKSFLNLVEGMNDRVADKLEGQLPINRSIRYHECMHDVGGPCSGYVNVEIGEIETQDIPAAEIVPEAVKTEIKKDIKDENDILKAEKVALEAENAELKKPKVEQPVDPVVE